MLKVGVQPQTDGLLIHPLAGGYTSGFITPASKLLAIPIELGGISSEKVLPAGRYQVAAFGKQPLRFRVAGAGARSARLVHGGKQPVVASRFTATEPGAWMDAVAGDTRTLILYSFTVQNKGTQITNMGMCVSRTQAPCAPLAGTSIPPVSQGDFQRFSIIREPAFDTEGSHPFMGTFTGSAIAAERSYVAVTFI